MFSPSQESYFLAVLGILLLVLKSGVAQGDSVSQSLSEVSITEGQDALLHCDFNTTSSNPYLFWYHQFPNHSPSHILTKHKYSNPEPTGKYSGTLNSKINAVTLKIWKVSPADEGISQSDSVSQELTEIEFQEGETAVFHCKFTTSDSNPSLFWYRQYVGREPQMVIRADKYTSRDNHFSEGIFSTTLFLENKTVPLKIKNISLQDEAVYFCALRRSDYVGSKLTFGRGTTLRVNPDLEPSLPSVYKLKPSSEEKQGKAACLFTDYSPNPLNVGINKEVTKEVNGSVVVVKEDKSEKGTASYGIVLWGDDTDSFHCHADAENPKGDSGTCLAEDGDITFETDERLNLLSFTVLGLRVIFLKTVSFNLLLTFRLWSR